MYICVLGVMYMCVRGHVYSCVRGINFASVSMIFLLDFGTVLRQWGILGFYFINLQKLSGSDPQKWFTLISNNGCNKARFWLAEIWNKFDWLKYKKKRFLEFINLFEWFIWRMVPKFMLIQKWIWPLWENYPHFCSSLTFIMTIMHYNLY